jgi:hypothetical protein
VRQVPVPHGIDYLAEYLIRLLGQGTPLEHVAIHLLEVDLHRVIQLIQSIHRNRYPIPVEHLKHFVPGQTTRAIEVEVLENLLDGHLADEVLRKVEVAVVLPVFVVVATAEPLYVGDL